VGQVVQTPTIVDAPAGFGDVSLCGAGATSRVYRASEARSGRVVALKRMHRQLVRSADALARLRRELESLRSIRHPGIVAVYDVIDWDGDPTIVMEYLPGEDLKERVLREGRLPASEAERIGRALLDILAVTHASGIVHRDVKPQNVRLGEGGRVCLLDFGSARLDAASQLTRTGTTVGTPEYMAPELFAASVYDPRVDFYGVGATLYECLTGRPPQTADSLAELAFLRTTADVPPVRALAPDTPLALAQVVDRCLAREPEERHATAALALWALDHPEAEAAFSARRSSHPPCLHCGTPIPASSTACARCHRHDPFAYSAGRWHVVVRSLREPARFIEYVARKFPERATPSHLKALAQRCAALSFAPQTYLAGIFGPEAAQVGNELAAVGAEVQLVQARRIWAPLIVALLVSCLLSLSAFGHPLEISRWLLATLLLGLLFAIPGVIAWNVPDLARASSSILSGSRLPRPVAPVFAGVLSAVMVAYCGVAAVVGLFLALDRSPFTPVPDLVQPLLWGLGPPALVVLTLGSIRFFHPRLRPASSPQPSLGQQSKIMFQIGADQLDRPHAISGIRQASPVVRSLTVLTVLASLLIAETVLLSASWEWLVRRAEWHPARAPAQVQSQVGFSPLAPPVTSPARSDRAPVQPAPTVSYSRHRHPEYFAYAIILGSIALLLASLLWRRHRARKDGAAIFAELDLTEFARLASRDCPIRQRKRNSILGGDGIATLNTADAFFADALRRAAELAPCLPTEAVARLFQTLEGVCKRIPAQREAERSLVARCILETDPEQKARFDFLALEGQMEALAAQEWAARLQRPS